MIMFYKIEIYPYYGAILSTIIGSLVVTIINLIWLNKTRKINYYSTLKQFGKVLICLTFMLVVMFILTMFIPLDIKNRLVSMGVIIVYTLMGMISYLFLAHKLNLIKETFENNIYQKIPFIKKYL